MRLKNMDENDVIKKLTDAKLPDIGMPARKAALKAALINAAAAGNKAPFLPFFRKLIPVFIAVLAAAGTTVYVVDNFDNGSKFNSHGGIWSTYSDAQEGGNSSVWPEAGLNNDEGFIMSQPGTGGKGYAARVTGRTGTALGLNYNYLGVVVRFDALSSCPTCKGADIKKYSGIKFSVKGNLEGGILYFILPYETSECVPSRMTCKSMTDYADYEADISKQVGGDWSTVVINFRTDLQQPDWTAQNRRFPVEKVLENVHLFKWQYKNGNGKVMDLWIDDLVLF